MFIVDPAADVADHLREVERRRLRSLVEADVAVADSLHAPDFQLVHPGGGVWSKEHYLAGIESGSINYRRFEAVSDIDVLVDGDVAVVRYRSAIDIEVRGEERGLLNCWHVDCYRRDEHNRHWQVVWSQATAINEDRA